MPASEFSHGESRPAADSSSKPTTGAKRGRASVIASLARSALAFFFVFATIAAAHLLMAALNAADYAISAESYGRVGAEARWFGEDPLLAECERLQVQGSGPAQARVADTASFGNTITLHMLPISSFLVVATVGLIVVGMGLLLVSRWISRDGLQSIFGVFGGLLIWTGAVEYGLMIASRLLGIAKSVDVHAERLIGTLGEYVLLKHTWGLLVLVWAYLLFLESNRCNLFLWFRRRLPLMRGNIANGRTDNYAPRTAFEYVTVVWTFYVLLLWAYDESVFGVHSLFTHALFFGSLATGGYLLLRLYRQTSIGPAIRYAIPTAIVCWTPVEIAAKWDLFTEPWLVLNPVTAATFFGGPALGTWLIVREIRRGPARATLTRLARVSQ